ncbi:MAG: 50S ribosomal protein L5 [bacterium]
MRTRYREQVIPAMMQEFGWTNRHQVPQLTKVIINIGIGEGSKELKLIEHAMVDIAAITGQRPVITRARKSVAAYKIREGMPIGTMVTLRAGTMLDFLDKLFNIALPRVRDFQGLNPNGFDTRGNYTMGLKEQIVFPEIEYDRVSKVRGMDITIVTTAPDDVSARRLLELLGMPLRKPRPVKKVEEAVAA